MSETAAPTRVLVVDDHPDTAESVARWLTLAGLETRTARDGASALEHTACFQPQVCIIDIRMPKVDGFEVARALRRASSSASAILIAHSGCTDHTSRARAEAAGFDCYFQRLVGLVDRG